MTTERRPVPYSLLAIPLAVAAYLIQTVPDVGIFLMMMGAVAWPALLVGAALLGTAIEVASGVVSRRWLLLPLLVFGTYEVCALVDHVQAWRSQRVEWSTGNAPAGRIPAAGRSVVIHRDSSSDLATGMVERYRVDAVYETTAVDQRAPRYMSYRLIPQDLCKGIRKMVDEQFVQTSGFHVRMSGAERLDPGACKLIMADVPSGDRVTVREQISRKDPHRRRSVMERTLHVTGPDGRSIVLRGGASYPLSWMPFFLAGCGLNSANPSWDCFLRPLRDTVGDPYGFDMEKRLAHVLGLRTREPGEVPSADPEMLIAAASGRLEGVRQREDDRAASLLDEVLADPSRYVAKGAIEALAESPGVTGPRLERMAALLEEVRDIVPKPQTVPVACTPESVHEHCRFLNASRNASSIHALLQWRIEESKLDDEHRRELADIRRRMRRDARLARQEARRLQMERIDRRNAADLRTRLASPSRSRPPAIP